MYSGVDKYGGKVVGNTEKAGDSLEQIIETASAEETLVVQVPIDEQGNTMEVLLKSQLNPDGGGLMWLQEENSSSTYNAVVAMSQMTSMLRDHDRNRKYELGLKHAIKQFKELNYRAPKVLDIGTGTGLLSMLASKHGAESVYACELFPTMADIASKVSKRNATAYPSLNNMKVIAKKSNDVTVGPSAEHDIPEKLDLAVFEIFDSVLLGEAVLPSLRHAYEHLLKENASIVPLRAKMYGQVVQNEEMFRMHSFSATQVCDGLRLARSEQASNCVSGNVALPFHIQHTSPQTTELSDVFEVFSFDFSEIFPPNSVRKHPVSVNCTANGTAHALYLWWDLELGPDVTYSTRVGSENWQDHWVQIVFPLGKQTLVTRGETIKIDAFHNDVNVWFSVPQLVDVEEEQEQDGSNSIILPAGDVCAPQCTCGMHMICNAERINVLTDASRNEKFSRCIENALTKLSLKKACTKAELGCLDVSDGTLGGLIAAAKGCKYVTSVESKTFSCMIYEQIAKGNALDKQMTFYECGCKGLLLEHLMGEKLVDLLVAEPFYYAMQNLSIWQALNFWYRRTAVQALLSEDAVVVPHRGVVKGALVQFEHLHECFGKAGVVEGFDHVDLDAMQEGWHKYDFPFPLWMYPYKMLTKPFTLMEINFSACAESFFDTCAVPVEQNGIAHGVVLWMDYDLDEEANYCLSTLQSKGHKQVVRFLPEPQVVDSKMAVESKVTFISHEGSLEYDFQVRQL